MSNLFKGVALTLIGATVVAMESDSRIEDRLESFKAKSNQLFLAESGLNCARSIKKGFRRRNRWQSSNGV